MIANLSDGQFIIVPEFANLRKGFDGLFGNLSDEIPPFREFQSPRKDLRNF